MWLGVGGPCPPFRNDIVTPRHLFIFSFFFKFSWLIRFKNSCNEMDKGERDRKILHVIEKQDGYKSKMMLTIRNELLREEEKRLTDRKRELQQSYLSLIRQKKIIFHVMIKGIR